MTVIQYKLEEGPIQALMTCNPSENSYIKTGMGGIASIMKHTKEKPIMLQNSLPHCYSFVTNFPVNKFILDPNQDNVKEELIVSGYKHTSYTFHVLNGDNEILTIELEK